MASTLTNLIYHVVFSTKNRVNLIVPNLEAPLHKYIGGIIRGERGKLLTIGGTEDHLHILARFRQSIMLHLGLIPMPLQGICSSCLIPGAYAPGFTPSLLRRGEFTKQSRFFLGFKR